MERPEQKTAWIHRHTKPMVKSYNSLEKSPTMKTEKTTGTHVHIPAEIQDIPKEQRRKKIKRLYHFTLNAFHQASLIPLRAALDPVTPGTMLAVTA